jgi:hypothetical protein
MTIVQVSGRLLLLVLVLCVVPRTTAQNNDSAACTLCVDGSEPNLDAVLGVTSCSIIASALLQTPSTDDICLMTQTQGFIYCDCPTFPDTFCSMCNTGQTTSAASYVPIPQQYRSLIIPGTDDITCGQAEFLSKDTGLCNVVQDAASFCGCAGTTRNDCYLCDTATATDNMMYSDRLLPPSFTVSCAALDRELGSSSECSANTLDAFITDIPVAVQEYCGCPSNSSNVTVPMVCTSGICGNSQAVRNPNATVMIGNTTKMTCQDLEIATNFITNETYCTSLLSTQAESICCVDSMNIPSDNQNNNSATVPSSTPNGTMPAPSPTANGTVPTSDATILATPVGSSILTAVVVAVVVMMC